MTEQTTQPDVKDLLAKANDEASRIRDMARQLMGENVLKAVDQAKAAGVEVSVAQIGTPWYAYRPLSRLEFLLIQSELAKEAQSLYKEPEANEADIQLKIQAREQEKMVFKGCVYPEINKLNIGLFNAGVIDTLHKLIMSASGFNQEVIPVKM